MKGALCTCLLFLRGVLVLCLPNKLRFYDAITYTYVCMYFVSREKSTAMSEMNGIELLGRVITLRVLFIQENVECGLNDPRMHDCDQQ